MHRGCDALWIDSEARRTLADDELDDERRRCAGMYQHRFQGVSSATETHSKAFYPAREISDKQS